MKTLIKILSLLLIVFIGKTAVSQNNEEFLQEFKYQTNQWKEAYNSKDAKNLIPFYAEQASYVSSHVEGLEIKGREQVIANFQKGINMDGRIDNIEILSMNVSCEIATLLCKYKANNKGSIAIGRNLLVLKKIDDKWLIIMHMTVI